VAFEIKQPFVIKNNISLYILCKIAVAFCRHESGLWWFHLKTKSVPGSQCSTHYSFPILVFHTVV